MPGYSVNGGLPGLGLCYSTALEENLEFSDQGPMRNRLLVTTALLTLTTCGPAPIARPASPGTPWSIQIADTMNAPPSQDGVRFKVDKSRREDIPVRLTASDGTGLELKSYQAKAVLHGPLAFTEVHLTFRNPQERVLEGRFEITLPEGAALSRLAMKNQKGWQEAEVVELQKARQAYEDFLHRRQDPALLEKQAGNQFQARIFPIPAGGDKELILSYSQELTSQQDYLLPLGGLPAVPQLSVEASVWSDSSHPSQKLHYTLKDEAPRGDLTIVRGTSAKGLVNGDFTLVAVTPQAKVGAVELQDLVVLVDTSASRAAGYKAQIDKLERVLLNLAQQRPQTRVSIAAFDQAVVPLYHGPLKNCQEAFRRLRSRRPLGATDLTSALRWAGHQHGYKRLLLVTDGVTTSGGAKLARVEGLERVDALMVGGIRDSQALRDLVFHRQHQSGLVLDGDGAAADLARSLLRKPLSGVKVSVQDAQWVWPEVLDGVEPGQERLVYAKLNKTQQELRVSLSGPLKEEIRVPLTPVTGPMLPRASVAAQLQRLNAQRLRLAGKDREQVARQMVALSTENRVVCDVTGLLVLETEADYARFGIDRLALKDILTVGQDGVELLHRQQVVTEDQAKNPPPPVIHKKLAKQNAETDQDAARSSGKDDRVSSAGAAAPASPLARPMDVSARDEKEKAEALPPAANAPAPRTAGSVSTSAPEPRPQISASHSERRQVHRIAAGPARHGGGASAGRPTQRPDIEEADKSEGAPALTGKLLEIDHKLKAGQNRQALDEALEWQRKQPGDVLALVGLGQAYEAMGHRQEAGRAYGSIIDLYPGRADLRRFAGCRLEALGKEGQGLACDTFGKALEQRPDHPSSYRMRAYALLRSGRFAEAFETLEKGTKQAYPAGRFAGCAQILREDLALVGAAWAAKDPSRRPEILKRLAGVGAHWEDTPSTRFVLTWETDANDVDFHIKDSRGGHAYYSAMALPSGGRLYADVTTGYGPECFAIPGKPSAGPYRIFIHYYSRGPMGYGMGKVEIVRHDGKGGLTFEERPYVVMNDQAYVNLGLVK